MTAAPREVLPVELLLTETQRRPIGRDRLDFEKRRITVADQERWQATGKPPHDDDADLGEFLTELRSIHPDGVKP